MIKAINTNYSLPKSSIFANKLVSFIRTTILLQFFCLACLCICYINFKAINDSQDDFYKIQLFIGIYFLSLVFTTQLDAFSRYQNYKMAKDLLYQYGFKTSLIKVFSKSRCQRDAIREAAINLGYKKEIDTYFYTIGYRWYHILPIVLVKKPTILLSVKYWQTTLFVPYYKSKFF
jgi:hypothetical protein